MPKIIIDLEKKLLASARKIIERDGFEAFSMKGVAKESSIAVGTIYNYYPDKNSIFTGIVQEDWLSLSNKITSAIPSLKSFKEGIRLLYDSFTSFSLNHQSLFAHFATSGNEAYYASYRNFVEEGGKLHRLIGEKFEVKSEASRCHIAASMFSYAIHYPNVPYEEIEDSIIRLL